VLISVGNTPGGNARLSLRLEPEELGRVQIQIERTHEAAAKIEITVERPETMNLLQRDQNQLHRALDQAGFPAEGRTLSFHFATPDQSFSGGGQSQAGQRPLSNDDAGGGAANGGGTGTRRQSRQPAPEPSLAPEPRTDRWLSAALDITA